MFFQLQEQEEARARWEEEFPSSEDTEEEELYDTEEEEEEEEMYESVEEEDTLFLPYPDDAEDRDFFLDVIL